VAQWISHSKLDSATIPKLHNNTHWVYYTRMLRPLLTVANEEAASPSFFGTSEVLKITGIPANTLNKLVERGSFGIAPSVRIGKGRGSRRVFGTHDIFGVALVWWLTQAGLRSAVIGRVLRQISPAHRNLAANAAGTLLLKHMKTKEPQILTITRRLEARGGKPEQTVSTTVTHHDFGLQRKDSVSIHLIPVGQLFAALMLRLEEIRPGIKV
jgi:hypothetical protein